MKENEPMPLMEITRALRDRVMPRHRSSWIYYLGGVTLLLFVVQFVTGIMMAFYYRPTTEAANQSIDLLMHRVPFGAIVRSLHAYSANALIAMLMLSLVAAFATRAYERPRRLVWGLSATLVGLGLAFGFTGYILPWDSTAYFGTRIGTEIAASIPIIGDSLVALIRGSRAVSQATLTRLFVLHVAALPLITAVVLGFHAGISILLGPHVPSTAKIKSERRLWPDFILSELTVWLVGIGLLLCLAVFFPWGLGRGYDITNPTEPPGGLHPEWYFMPLFVLLRFLPDGIALTLVVATAVFWTIIPWLDGRARTLVTWIGWGSLLATFVLLVVGYATLDMSASTSAAIAPKLEDLTWLVIVLGAIGFLSLVLFLIRSAARRR